MSRFEDYTPTTEDIKAAWVAQQTRDYNGLMSEGVAAQAFEDWLGDLVRAVDYVDD